MSGSDNTWIALIGDFDEKILAHRAINAALHLASNELGLALKWDWLHTGELAGDAEVALTQYNGIWCVPGSPYANTEVVLRAIRVARELKLPYLGTCAGFQHALMEYAQNVWQLPTAGHAELSPEAVDPVISRLACSLVEASETLELVAGTRLASIYGTRDIVESYHCNFGLNPVYDSLLASGELCVSARDSSGQVRAVELRTHPFFLATLFQPERAALAGRVPPLVGAFAKVCSAT